MNKQRFIMLLALLLPSVSSPAADHDIVVTDRAIVQRCVTSSDARNIAVGMPGGFNFMFDPVRCRLAHVWFGGFLDYRGEATGRGGMKLQLLGVKQFVGTAELPIRIGNADREPESIRFEGYRKEPATGIPTFLFTVDGVRIEQRVLSFGPDQVAVELSFPELGDVPRYYLTEPQAVRETSVSDGLTQDGSGTIKIPASETWAQIRLALKPSKEKFVRQEPTTNGRLLYALHCMSCHTLDGKKRIGPSFADLWTQDRVVSRGGKTETIKADEAYIRESILNPQAAIVQGFEQANKMVDIRKTLNEKQIDALVQLLLDLKDEK